MVVLRFGTYVRAKSPQDAYELLRSKKGSRIVGGGGWMRLSRRSVGTVIDLGDCGLDAIDLTHDDPVFGDALRIGAYVTLRSFELDEHLDRASGGAAAAAVRDIVGVQFRNLATVGGSVCGRFGFSDVCLVLLALGAHLEFVGAGRIPLEAFLMDKAACRDVLTHVIVPAAPAQASYQAVRRQATDFPVINVCAAHTFQGWRVAVGARPGRPRLVVGGAQEGDAQEGDAQDASNSQGAPCVTLTEAPTADEVEAACASAQRLTYSTNMLADSAYRQEVAPVLVRRAIEEAAR